MTKRQSIISVTVYCAIILVALFVVYPRHYVSYSACYELPYKSDFYPLAYKFINTKHEFEFLIRFHDKQIDINDFFKTYNIDLKKHTYLWVYGAPIKVMFHSIKTTLFDDPSPCYCSARRYRQKYVLINYGSQTGLLYIYELDKDESLTSPQGP